MQIWYGAVFLIGLIVEMITLIAIWKLSVQRKVFSVLSGTVTLVLVSAAISILFRISIPARAYLAFGGMYVFSGLIWRWWKYGVTPDRWGVAEIALAVLATTMFSIASTA